MAAWTLLLKLHQRGVVELPARRQVPTHRMRCVASELAPPEEPSPAIDCPLGELGPLRIQEVSREATGRTWVRQALGRHHYVGLKGTVGENLQYIISGGQGRGLGCLVFGAGAWKCQDRDQFIRPNWSFTRSCVPSTGAVLSPALGLAVHLMFSRFDDHVAYYTLERNFQERFGVAILNEYTALVGYLRDGRFEIDSNLVENDVRPSAVGKKSWLFIGHPDAGWRSAVIYTLIQSCRRYGTILRNSLTARRRLNRMHSP